MGRSFIYIASLRRTGSTVLSEALTSFPHSFIFREPALARNRFNVKRSDLDLFLEYGIDLQAFSERFSRPTILGRIFRRDRMLRAFKEELLPQLLGIVEQIGVKEIHHRNWRLYSTHFPDMKIILTGRDPRDIYISIRNRAKRGKSSFRGHFSPKDLADDLNRDFKYQLAMFQEETCFKIRYEDFCTNLSQLEEIKTFVGIDSNDAGAIGKFNANNPHREEEYKLHGRQITDVRVRRWEKDSDKELVANAQRVFDLMPEYTSFWGYERD